MHIVIFRDYDVTEFFGVFDSKELAEAYITGLTRIHGEAGRLPQSSFARPGDLCVEPVDHNPKAF